MGNNDFEFNYSAPTTEERKEIESIRNNYLAPSERQQKLEKLRKLDWKVGNIPMILSLGIGIVGALIFGLGLAMILEWNLLVWGIVICIVALAPMLIAYPSYNISSKKMKEKYTNEILKLSEELLNEGK